jgi:hypothetical protein
MGKNSPTDYTMNKEAAESLANEIQKFWHDKGCSSVEVWVETIPVYNRGEEKRIATRFEINSNIIQSLSSLENDNYI